jgi:hypothetical protein
MGYRMGKHDQQIRSTDPAFHIRAGFAENLSLTSVFPADIPVLPFHTFISAKYYNTHNMLLCIR